MSVDTTGIDLVLRELGRLPAVGKAALPAVGEAVLQRCEENIQAQKAPDGRAWTPGRSGQGRVLSGARKALAAAVAGKTLVVTLSGVEARHHLGAIKGGGSIALGPGGKRRDTRHQRGEREAMARSTGEAFTPGRRGAYARPILPDRADPMVAEAFRESVAAQLDPTVWRRR